MNVYSTDTLVGKLLKPVVVETAADPSFSITPEARHYPEISVTVKPVYFPSDFRIPLDEAMLADPSSILQGKIHSAMDLNFSSALVAYFGSIGVHRPMITLLARCPYNRMFIMASVTHHQSHPIPPKSMLPAARRRDRGCGWRRLGRPERKARMPDE